MARKLSLARRYGSAEGGASAVEFALILPPFVMLLVGIFELSHMMFISPCTIGAGAVVVSGAGSYFCAGFDLLEYAEAADPAALFADSTRYHRSVHTFAKPIIAAIEGSAVAGGLDLALMCDLRVASDQATFGQPQVRHGIPAAYDLLAPVVGDSIARDLCLSGRLLTAEDALQCGLVQRVVNAGAVVDEALALAADFAALPGSAATKQMFLANQRDLFPAS